MKKILYITILILTTLLYGCNINEIPEKEKVKVVLSGAMRTSVSGIYTKGGGEGMITPIPDDPDDPDDYPGLPPWQLSVGIITIELDRDNSTPLDPTEWNTETAYLDPGFFGGEFIGDKPENYTEDDPDLGRIGLAWSGKIEYTNLDGTAIQQVFYDESGIYYYLMCIYPYEFVNIMNDVSNGVEIGSNGAWVYFDVDGSQDIMASTMGSGNIDNQFHAPLQFSHKLTALRCNFIAESDVAAELYGDITSVELLKQPNMLQLNVGQSVRGYSGMSVAPFSTDISYSAVSDYTLTDGLPLLSLETDPTPDPVEFGYMLVMPAQTYTFKITTSARGANNPFYGTYTFGASLPEPGTVYNLTFKMLETAEIILEAGDPENWNFEQIYD